MQPSLTRPPQTDSLVSDLCTCRRRTLSLIEGIPSAAFSQQAHPDFSPVGWHLGHIAYTEAFWILGEAAMGSDATDCLLHPTHYATLFAADGLPKSQRQHLPALPALLNYLNAVRSQTLARIKQTSPCLLHWLLQHEGQHAETMAMVLAMHAQNGRSLLEHLPDRVAPNGHSATAQIEGGEFWQGADAPWAIDNERPRHRVRVEGFEIDRNLVTCGEFAQFIAAGGYEQALWWSEAGWAWRQQMQICAPLYWSDAPALKEKPVCGVSGYEAEAYARSLGKRLPTESEWEYAAASDQCRDMFGSVWQWTDTWFDGYQGFWPFPYAGYSQTYFDGEHRILKGSSWASPPSIQRRSFRNWYHPHRRELFAGFRCAQQAQ